MSLIIGIPCQAAAGERRIAITPDIAKRFQSLNVAILIETGAGAGSYFRDKDFEGALIAQDRSQVFTSKLVLTVQALSREDIQMMEPGSFLIGLMAPYQNRNLAEILCKKNITSFAMELIPRVSRAQSMDALSSQATVAGYQCVMIAASLCPKFFPMITYAAGTLRPARILVIGTGVAGLQAIATARRLGAIVEAYDVRPETREEVESLGARFIETGVSATGTGGYARDLTEEEKKQQQARLAKAVAQVDVLITTAAVPGKKVRALYPRTW